jgi:hypothetical protein
MIQFNETRLLLISLLYDEEDEDLVDVDSITPEEQRRLLITTAAALIEIILCEITNSADDAREGLARLMLDMGRNIDERYASARPSN